MPNEQMLQHGVKAFAFLAIQLRVFVEGDVPGPADSLDLAEHTSRFACNFLEFLAHFGCVKRGIFIRSGQQCNSTLVLLL